MRINRPTAILLGAFAFLPLIDLALLLGYIVPRVNALAGNSAEATRYFTWFNIAFWSQVSMFGISLALIGLFAVLAYRVDTVPPRQRSTWILLVTFGNLLAIPVFWYVYIWHGRTSRAVPSR